MISWGEIDLLAFYRGRRFIIETKIWYGDARYEQTKTQLLGYLKTANLDKGYLIIFDERMATNTLLAAAGDHFVLMLEGKTVRVYLISVTV